jgi:phage terminase large subunit-like protein
MSTATRTACPVKQFATSVVKGKTVAGSLVRLACERHLRDLKDGKKRGLWFDRKASNHIHNFFGLLKLPEGDRPFELAPWQKFITGSLFGWKGPDNLRRFRTAYIEAGKGSGKSPLAAGIGLFGLEADDELAAEIYAAAVSSDQAHVVFRDGKNMAEASPALVNRLEINAHNIACLKTKSFFRPVSSEHRGLDGKRVHIAIVDEVHEHATPLVIDKMRAGTKGRKQALLFQITNSGHDRTTVCWRQREYSEKVLKGTLPDDSWFAYVCNLDPCAKCSAEGKTQPTDGCPDCDDWRDPKVWLKACPNLGVSVTHKYLEEQVREAQGMPAKENIVKRLNFCIWTEQNDRVIPMDAWDAGARTIDRSLFNGQTCYGGLDIGATSDFTAFVLLFPHDDAEPVEIMVDDTDQNSPTQTIMRRSYSLIPFFWLPETPVKRDAQLQHIISGWTRQGFIRKTPGAVVDYDQVLEDIIEITEPFGLAGIGFDRGFQGSQMGTNLMKHFGDQVIQVPQGILTMNAPFREFLELLKLGRLFHDGNPTMRWHVSNVAAEIRGGLMKPSKDRSSEKIDGVTAAVMALAVATQGPDEGPSIYSEPGNFAL